MKTLAVAAIVLGLAASGAAQAPAPAPAPSEWKAGEPPVEMTTYYLAGPLTDGGTIRGLCVFKAASLEEARAFEDDDPAVKAGRLAVEAHPWMVQKGILP
jgi:hypothetical protein